MCIGEGGISVWVYLDHDSMDLEFILQLVG